MVKKGQKYDTGSMRSNKKVRESTLQTRRCEEEGEELLQAPEQIPLQRLEEPTQEQVYRAGLQPVGRTHARPEDM